MNRNLMTAAGLSLGACSYVSPEVTVAEIHSEGVLCSSFEVYKEEELEW